MVFISYSRDDKAFVEPLVKLLRASGQDVFFDKDNIEYGKNWKEALEEAIMKCKRFLLFWSKSTKKSEIVKQEITVALATPLLVIVPIILDNSPLPNEVSEFNGSDDLIPLFKKLISQKKRNKRILKIFIFLLVLLPIILMITFFKFQLPTKDPIGLKDPLAAYLYYPINPFLVLELLLVVSFFVILILFISGKFKIKSKYKVIAEHLILKKD